LHPALESLFVTTPGPDAMRSRDLARHPGEFPNPERTRWLEDPGRDFPYYRGSPVALGWTDWAIVLAALAVGFVILTKAPAAPPFLGSSAYHLLTALLFSAVPLAALAWRTSGKVGALFNGFRTRYVGWGLFFGVLNILFTLVIGKIATDAMELSRNATVSGLAQGGPPEGIGLFYLRTGIQLFGEEIITILPFLFLLWLGASKLGLSRTTAILLAWVGSALLFAAVHLPTYDWHVAQALLLIGPVRMVLTLAYIKTKSIWTSTIAHVVNDWSMFTFTMLMAASGVASS